MKSRIKKHLILLASALIAIPAILAPVRASAANNGYGSMVAPNVTPDMETAAYWIAKNPNANDLLMTPQQIEQLNKDIENKENCNVQDLKKLPQHFDGNALKEGLIRTAKTEINGLYFQGAPVPAEFYNDLIANIENAETTNNMPLRYGIIVNQSVLRDLPYPNWVQLSDSANDLEWDNLVSTAVYVNEPVAVYFFTADHGYAYVRSGLWGGFVQTTDLAMCKDRQEWLDAQNMSKFLVVTGNRVYLEYSIVDAEASQKMLYMGTKLEVVTDSDAMVSNRTPWNSYVVKLPTRQADGSYAARLASIPRNRDVHYGYMPFTSANILIQAFKCLGDRYGWGGSLYADDCSLFVRNVYACFGLRIPRNTTWQGNMPVQVVDLSQMDLQTKAGAILSLTPGAIIEWGGHEVIYLGEDHGGIYTINNVSSMADPATVGTAELKALRVRSVIVNDILSTFRLNGKTWFETFDKTIQVWVR